MIGCKHKWIEKARRFTPPVQREVSIESGTSSLFERLSFGFTTIEEECDRCHKVGATVLLGDQTK